MADVCTTSEEGEQMDTTEDNNNKPGLDAEQEDLASWINRNKGSSAPLTLCEEERMRRTLMRIDRSGSTESVVTTSGVESCNSCSEPGSPVRPVTPPMPPLPTHHHPTYDECLRDSEDSGLGPSPAKSVIGGRPNSPVSPIQFGSRCSDDSLLDLSPRTDNSYESEDNPKTDDAFYDEDDEEDDDENDAPIPKSPGSFKFLLSSSSNSQRTDEDFRSPQFQSSLLDDPFRCGTTTTTPQQTKFPSPLLAATTVATFRCGPTTKPPTNVDHTFRHCNPPTSKQDATASYCDERARQQQDSNEPSNLSDHQFLKNHLNQQQVSPDKLTDKLNDHFLKTHLSQQPPSSDEVSSNNLTDKLNDHHFLKNHLNHQQPINGEGSLDNLTDKLNDHFLTSHLNQQQPNSGEVSSTNLTDKLKDHLLKNHLNQPSGSSATLTDKLSDHHFLQSHHLNPKVVLIRSNFGGHGGYAEESSSNSSRQFELTTGSSDCTSSNCSQAGVDAQGSSSGSSASVDDGACKWLDCDRSADANTTATDLVDHIRQCHVREQSDDGKSFVCLWVGCKVYDRPSCSRSWLERHVLLHGGSKPFRCIVDGCHQRFGSEVVLERHVNSHFPQRTKLNNHCKRKSRHKQRKRPTSNKSKDFFDDAAMEHVRHNLLLLSSITGINSGGPPSAITFRSHVIGRRTDSSGKVHLLLHWNPQNMLPDSWIPETEMLSNLEKTIPVSSLPPHALQLPSMVALAKTGVTPRPGKRKRK